MVPSNPTAALKAQKKTIDEKKKSQKVQHEKVTAMFFQSGRFFMQRGKKSIISVVVVGNLLFFHPFRKMSNHILFGL